MSEQNEGTPAAQPAAAPTPASARQALLARQRELEKSVQRLQKTSQRAKRQAAEAAALPSGAEEEESWLMTYLDMLTLLLVLLVVMLAFAGKNTGDAVRQLPAVLSGQSVLPEGAGLLKGSGPDMQTAEGMPDPLEGLELGALGEDIDVVVKEGTVSFRISSEILFSSGQAELSLDGLRVLRQLISVLNSSTHNVAVVGHTDNVPIRNVRFPSNWELSSARAGSVVRYLESNGVASNRLRAVGYADTQPLVDNASAEGKATNRRVELILEQPR
ncbi:OmpA family protein [Pseudomonas sp. NW5]|uniref:OmpA/MotB family protein n=1 Tax=Pseudomonas sp. NW5 TaxID=2934934 RepID=UPI00202094E2|nr:OmpA family protein [Pseudomonas sp. NW5]MCL7462348.1 OmpA family protein [Pseudomonas sp. NW5]